MHSVFLSCRARFGGGLAAHRHPRPVRPLDLSVKELAVLKALTWTYPPSLPPKTCSDKHGTRTSKAPKQPIAVTNVSDVRSATTAGRRCAGRGSRAPIVSLRCELRQLLREVGTRPAPAVLAMTRLALLLVAPARSSSRRCRRRSRA
jgi:hypothetical protein